MPVFEYVPAKFFHVCEARTAHDDALDELARLVGDGETLIHNGTSKAAQNAPVPVAPVAYEGPALANELPAWANAEASNTKPFDFDLHSRLEEAFGAPKPDAAPTSVFETVAGAEPVSEIPMPAPVQTADELDAELAAELDRALADEIDVAAFQELNAPPAPQPMTDEAPKVAAPEAEDDPFAAELAKLLKTPEEPLSPIAPPAPPAPLAAAALAPPAVAYEPAANPAAPQWHEEPFVAEPHMAHAALAAGGSSRKRNVALAIAAVALMGGGAAFALNFFNTDTGPAPVIMADKDPVKVRPAETGGTVVPNQDRAVYREVEGDQVAAKPQETLADRSEEPIKVAVQRPEGNGQLLQPRSVRTVTVRPDGTIVGSTKAAPAASADTTLPQPTLSLQGDAITVQPLEVTPQPVEEVAAVPAEPVAPQVLAPEPAATPKVETPKPVEVAKIEPTPEPKVAATPKPATVDSPFAVQISSQRSQAAAEKSYSTMSRRYASVLEGKGVDIRKADIAGKGTYYRVRIPAQTRSEANALCGELKSAGGSCFVTR